MKENEMSSNPLSLSSIHFSTLLALSFPEARNDILDNPVISTILRKRETTQTVSGQYSITRNTRLDGLNEIA